MNARRLFPLAAVAGIAVAVGVATAAPGGAPSTPQAASTPQATSSASAGRLAPQPTSPPIDDRSVLGGGPAAAPGTVGGVQTVADPAGGAPWALRTFQRGSGEARTWCAQLGREVGGEFVWIKPGENRAHRITAAESRTTVCANRPKWTPWADSPWSGAPASPTAGMAIAGMPDRSPDDPAARLGASLAWGVTAGTNRQVRVEQNGSSTAVLVARHGFLRVQPGTAAPSRATFTFAALDGSPQTVVADTFPSPTKFAPVVENGRDPGQEASGGPMPPMRSVPATLDELHQSEPAALTQVAALGATARSKGQQALFAREPAGKRPGCVSPPTASLGGRPVRQLFFTGMVVEGPVDCRPIPREADRRPVSIGSGWQTNRTDLSPADPAAVSDEARRVERRVPTGDGGVLIATPRGARLLEVTSPVGVKTVRVSDARVTWVSWQGQPQVRRALLGDGRGDPNITYRALDASGHQLGENGYAWPPEWANTTQRERQRPRP